MANTPTTALTEGLLEWWHIAVFAVTSIIGYALGTAKRGWTLEQLQLKIALIEKRFEDLERSTDADSRTLGLLGNDLSHIRASLADIKAKLENL
jgi:hypothetical protein